MSAPPINDRFKPIGWTDPRNAIDFALDEVAGGDACSAEFLRAWREDRVRSYSWVHFAHWLRDHRPHVATTEPSRLRMWCHQITFTAATVVVIEVILAFFR